MISLLLVTTAWAVNMTVATVVLYRAQGRVYRYAADRADLTERGRAYSDMATVIVLDGKVDR